MIKAVLFDLDGTLIDTVHDLAASANFALKTLSLPLNSTEDYIKFIGNGVPTLLKRASSCEIGSERHTELLKLFREYYNAHCCDNSLPYDGIHDLLKTLRAKSIKTAVVTNKLHEMAVKMIDTYFPNMFDIVVGSGKFQPKPDTTMAKHIVSELNLRPEECLFIGDSGVDMQVAKSCGMTALGVLWGYRDKKELCEMGAGILKKAPSEIKYLF